MRNSNGHAYHVCTNIEEITLRALHYVVRKYPESLRSRGIGGRGGLGGWPPYEFLNFYDPPIKKF